jgi:hypothetical protein
MSEQVPVQESDENVSEQVPNLDKQFEHLADEWQHLKVMVNVLANSLGHALNNWLRKDLWKDIRNKEYGFNSIEFGETPSKDVLLELLDIIDDDHQFDMRRFVEQIDREEKNIRMAVTILLAAVTKNEKEEERRGKRTLARTVSFDNI